MGDFNAIVSSKEYKGSRQPAKIPMQDFFNWSDQKQLIHIPTFGNSFTWCNGRKGRHRTEKRLDRAICNLSMLDSCASIACNTLVRSNSDHYPILVSIMLGKKIFQKQLPLSENLVYA